MRSESGVVLHPVVIPVGYSTSTLSFAVVASTSPTTYELTVTAAAAGVASQSGLLAVAVIPVTPALPPWSRVGQWHDGLPDADGTAFREEAEQVR